MRNAPLALVLILAATFAGCAPTLYRSPANFDYRVAHLQPTLSDSLLDDKGQKPEPGRIAATLLKSGDITLEPSAGAHIGLIAKPTPELASKAETSFIAADGDQRIRISVPPNTYAVGFYIHGPNSAPPPQGSAVIASFGGAPDFRVDVPGPGYEQLGASFVGILSFKPITSVTWIPGPGSSSTSISGLVTERR